MRWCWVGKPVGILLPDRERTPPLYERERMYHNTAHMFQTRRDSMFQRLDELHTGSLYILTGQAGAGKSHLAAAARRTGAL
ncbi:hypothetical protein Rcas_3400 [Roseiflexus castenholzii DSM 13941]|uniref:Uncharacterized protein n=1 Tax=Roseiflexus castenholzii (strain DSM 13941 / HLO8) TaxID=383372 RepID=A7NPF4_ROSCS|nr:hypothetical protein Rcas_3400 [Roseiflexus castenholzii DSM 13941]